MHLCGTPRGGLEQAHYCRFIAGPVDSRPAPVEANNAQMILEDAKRQLLGVLRKPPMGPADNPLALSRSSWIEQAGIPDDRVAAKAVSQLVKDGNAMAATIEYRIYVPASPEGAATIRGLGAKGTHTLDRARTWRWVLGLGLVAIFIALGSIGSGVESGGSETTANNWGSHETILVLLGITMGGYLAYILSAVAHPIANQMHRLHGALGEHFKAVVKRVTIALLIAMMVTYLALGILSEYLDVAEAVQVAFGIFIPVATGVGYITFELGRKNAER